MQEWIIQMMNQFGYWGILLLIAVENVFPPIPSEVILTFGGFMTTYTEINIWLVALYATIGSVLGAMVLYGVGYLISPERLERILKGKIGRILHLKIEDIKKAEGWFAKKGKLTVFLCRFIPIIRSLISIPAGMSRMHLIPFFLLTTAGTSIWNLILVWLGAIAGASWETIAGYMDVYSWVAFAALAVLFLVAVYLFWRKFIRKSKTPVDSLKSAEKTSQNSAQNSQPPEN